MAAKPSPNCTFAWSGGTVWRLSSKFFQLKYFFQLLHYSPKCRVESGLKSCLQFSFANFYLLVLTNKIYQFLYDNLIYWKTGVLVFIVIQITVRVDETTYKSGNYFKVIRGSKSPLFAHPTHTDEKVKL